MADEQTTGRPLSDKETNDLVDKIQSVLTPDLLEPKYRKQSEGQHPTFGHCASATQAAYYMLGGKESGYVPQVAKEDDGTTHWWLRHRQTGHVIDPTKEQYTSQGEKPPYDRGRGCGFPNPNPDAPSRRGQEIIDRISGKPFRQAKASGGPVEDQDIASPAPAEDEGITAYHGSPHEFERFDTSKIGTGEGAQAYGHGLYFAEHEPVAKEYRDKLSPGSALLDLTPKGDAQRQVLSQLKELGDEGFIYSIDDLQSFVRGSSSYNEPEMMTAFNRLAARAREKNPGHMYEVKIKANPDHFLDWDKPISHQSEKVQTVLRDMLRSAKKSFEQINLNGNPTGGQVHHLYSQHRGGNNKSVSDHLLQNGIPGIKYFDSGSRDEKDGTRNYVVFDDKLIDIKRRYEMGGAVPMASGGEAGDTQSMPKLTSEQQSLLDQLSRAIDRVYPAMDAAEARQPVIRHEPTMPGEPALTREQHQEYNIGQLQNALARVPTDYPTGPIGYAEGGDVGDNPAVQKALALTSGVPTPVKSGESGIKSTENPNRIMVPATGPGGIKGIVIPRHMWFGGNGATGRVEGLNEINKARAAVYGSQNRDPLTIGKVADIHRDVLDEHFKLPIKDQIFQEKQALERLRRAKHIPNSADTLKESEKLDTVRHEFDENGRPFVAYGSKGIAGYALYSSGHGPNQKFHVLNVCPGSTTGCSGGIDANGIVDTSRGTCFAPNSESRMPSAAVTRATHSQAKFDPAMTSDWILAHTGSLRRAARKADKKEERLLFRPNVVDESDRSSSYAIKLLNDQRAISNLPSIILNSYGKTSELHDPANGVFITHSNVGPKTKLGYRISENIQRDKQRIRSTILAQDAAGRDFVNSDGNKTPPKGSYMVTDVRRDSPLDEQMKKAFKYAKYWSVGRPVSSLSKDEIAEGEEAHYDGKGKLTTPEKAHYGHITLNGNRYDYQKQHILHPRLVQVGNNPDGSPHMIPTDSRFKDEEFLPKSRYMTRTGKPAGHILLTTPTTSTSNIGHQTSFTHHVDDSHIEYAKKNRGEYEIDPPAAQEASAGKEYVPPREAGHFASGGSVGEDTIEESMAFPEQSHYAQIHNVHRSRHNDEKEIGSKRSHGIKSIDRALRLTSQYNQPTRGRP